MDFLILLVFNALLLIILMAIILIYHKQESRYRSQVLNKMDVVAKLLQDKNAE